MNRKTLLTAAMITALSTGLTATAITPVFAAETTQASKEQTQADQDLIKVSDDAMMTMRNVGGARLAIFDGSPDRAQLYADAAVTRANATLKEADQYALDIKEAKKTGDEYVPFNASLMVDESLVPSKKKPEHIHNGQTQNAIKTLKVNGMDVALTTELIPIKAAKTHIDNAEKLIGKGKYYQANLELKAVEDSVITEIVDTDAIHQGKSHS